MKNSDLLSKLMQTPRIKSLGLKEESVSDILSAYANIAFETLLENGKLDVGEDITLEIVQLVERVHVLRGVRYPANRKYKLKITMEDDLYKKIESYYERLREEIS